MALTPAPCKKRKERATRDVTQSSARSGSDRHYSELMRIP